MTAKGQDAPPASEEAAVMALLSDPGTFGLRRGSVKRVDTHVARVFLAGDRAYKIKRPVRYHYLDFSTLEGRRAALDAELKLNRRTAPELYEAVRPITRAADGGLRVGGRGRPVEWVLVMRRFPDDALFDAMACDGRLSADLMIQLAHETRRLHDQARQVNLAPGEASRRVRDIAAENFIDLQRWPRIYPAAKTQAYERALDSAIEKAAPLIEARAAKGLIRHCHGDLHLANICLLDGRPRLFDCLEFSPILAEIDPLYDLAFLIMDLERHARRDLANKLLSAYTRTVEDVDGLALLPLFLSLRAAIRAKVSGARAALAEKGGEARELKRDARSYFEMACAYLRPPPAFAVAIGGLSGSGKSTLATRLAPQFGPAPGALHLRSDKLRKDHFGVAETTRLPPSAYLPEVSAAIYERLFKLADHCAGARHAVIVDATFLNEGGRRRIETIAHERSLPFLGIWLEASETTLMERVAARRGDASDATRSVVRQQIAEDTGDITWRRIDAAAPVDALLGDILKLIDDGVPPRGGTCLG